MTKILLRIAAGMMLLHGLGLIIGTFTQSSSSGIPYDMVNFIRGATFSGILLVLLLAALLWVLSSIKDKSGIKLLCIVAVAMLLLGIIEIIYFFPYIVCIIPAALTFIALFKLRKLS
ncbi:MAG: hypothetical protein FWD82_01475 [Defluviitaleaceae bacterium]|nr:hypothetical protein [Defluviitaleaceae bacterium]